MTGQQLAHWRNMMGFAHQKDAAKALGVPYRTYQRWEATGAPDHVHHACRWLWLRLPAVDPWLH